MNWLTFIVIAYILLSAHRGYRKGLVLSAYSLISTIIAVIFMACLTPIVRNVIDKEFYPLINEKIPGFFRGYFLNAVSFIICTLLILLVIAIIKVEINKIIKDSVLRIPDMIAGMALGVMKAFIIIWIAFLIFEWTSSLEFSRLCLEQIQENSILQMLSESNLIKQILQMLQAELIYQTKLLKSPNL